MTIQEYQDQVGDVLNQRWNFPDSTGIAYCGLGLAGEAGECAEEIKKALRYSKGHFDKGRKAKLQSELGDVLYYMARVANEVGIRLEDVLSASIDKMYQRLNHGK